MSRKPCPPGSFRNPATNRCVKKSGALGKKILKDHPSLRSRSPVLIAVRRPRQLRVRKSPCSPGKIRNPATNRCVDRFGRVGKKIVGEHPSMLLEQFNVSPFSGMRHQSNLHLRTPSAVPRIHYSF